MRMFTGLPEVIGSHSKDPWLHLPLCSGNKLVFSQKGAWNFHTGNEHFNSHMAQRFPSGNVTYL